MYKFWIKTVVLYPKMYIWSQKNKKFVLFTLKILEVFAKTFVPFTLKMISLKCTNFGYPKNCSFVPKNVHLVLKKKITFCIKNEVFDKEFHQNVQILDKNCSFVPKNVHLVLKNKKIVIFTLKMKFLPNNFTKMYKFWIKTVVLYPKMHIWSRKNKKFVLFTLKMKFLLKIWPQICFVPKKVHLVPKNGKNCTFYAKNEVLPKNFTQM